MEHVPVVEGREPEAEATVVLSDGTRIRAVLGRGDLIHGGVILTVGRALPVDGGEGALAAALGLGGLELREGQVIWLPPQRVAAVVFAPPAERRRPVGFEV